MNLESAIEKLQRIPKEKEMQKSEHRGGSIIVEKNRSRRGVEKSRSQRRVDYLVIGYKVVVTFIIIFGMCRWKKYNEKM